MDNFLKEKIEVLNSVFNEISCSTKNENYKDLNKATHLAINILLIVLEHISTNYASFDEGDTQQTQIQDVRIAKIKKEIQELSKARQDLNSYQVYQLIDKIKNDLSILKMETFVVTKGLLPLENNM